MQDATNFIFASCILHPASCICTSGTLSNSARLKSSRKTFFRRT
jgi:hypothetical protein